MGIERITRGVCNRFRDSAYRLGADAFKKLVTHMMKNNKSSEQIRLRKEGILRRIIDQDYRLMGMALNRLKSQANALYNLKRGFLLRILDKNVRKMGEAMRVLRMNAYEMGQAEMKLKNKQEGIINRMMNANIRMMGAVLRYLKHINDQEKNREERELRMKTGILNRIMDSGVRYQSMAWRSA